jgi:hypothetical protein
MISQVIPGWFRMGAIRDSWQMPYIKLVNIGLLFSKLE